jgi:adenine-specific DNA-methyltransferase
VAKAPAPPASASHADGLRVFNWEPGPAVDRFAETFYKQSFKLSQDGLKPDGWRLESGANLRLLDLVRAAGTPLGKYVRGRFFEGSL